jgi:hypothetical protein
LFVANHHFSYIINYAQKILTLSKASFEKCQSQQLPGIKIERLDFRQNQPSQLNVKIRKTFDQPEKLI